jgi:hypothetical protein
MGLPLVREYVEHDSGGKSSDYRKQLGQGRYLPTQRAANSICGSYGHPIGSARGWPRRPGGTPSFLRVHNLDSSPHDAAGLEGDEVFAEMAFYASAPEPESAGAREKDYLNRSCAARRGGRG